jgi:hypothetical protein
MMNFINSLLPLPALNASSSAWLKLGFVKGKLTTISAEFYQVPGDALKEKLILNLTHYNANSGLELQEITSVASATVADQYATIDNFENIKTTVSVTHAGGVTRNELVAWDYTPVRAAIAAGEVDGKNAKFVVNGFVGNTSHTVTMNLYILDGDYSYSEPHIPEIDPYDGVWRSKLPTAHTMTFTIDIGGSGSQSFNVNVGWDTSGVHLNTDGGTYTAYISWNGKRAERQVTVKASLAKSIASTNIPTSQYIITNVDSVNHYNSATVTMDDSSTYTYNVSWSSNATQGLSYGSFTRTGTITTISETFPVTQEITLVALVTNAVEYQNAAYGDSIAGMTGQALSYNDGTNGRIYFIDQTGALVYTTVATGGLNMNGSPSRIANNVGNGDPYTDINPPQSGENTFSNGGLSGNVLVTLNSAGSWGFPSGRVVPIELWLGCAYTMTGNAPRANAGNYVDVSPGLNNVYKKSLTKGSVLTAKDMPTMVLRAAIYAEANTDGAIIYMNTANGVPDLKINWNFTGLDINAAVGTTVRVTGTFKYKDGTGTVYCDVTII